MGRKVERTRNAGTMTEAEFWSMIRSALRRRSQYWKPIAAAKRKARRKNQSANKRLKWEYQCSSCLAWFKDKEVIIDHIKEAGSLRCAEDAGKFIERLFCEEDNLQSMCLDCHKVKNNEYRKNKKK